MISADVLRKILSEFIHARDFQSTWCVSKHWRRMTQEAVLDVRRRRQRIVKNVVSIAKTEGASFRNVPISFRLELARTYTASFLTQLHPDDCHCDCSSKAVGSIVDAQDYLNTWGIAVILQRQEFRVGSPPENDPPHPPPIDPVAAQAVSPPPSSPIASPMRSPPEIDASSSSSELYYQVRYLGWSAKWCEWVKASSVRCLCRRSARMRRWAWHVKFSNVHHCDAALQLCGVTLSIRDEANAASHLSMRDCVVSDVTTFLLDPSTKTAGRLLGLTRAL